MGRSTFILNLPDELVAELNTKIRESNYGDCDRISDWLKSQGAPGSRSSLHRYMQKLKLADGYAGKGGSYELAASMKGSSGHVRLEALFRKLGEIEYERDQVLSQIRDITRQEAAKRELQHT